MSGDAQIPGNSLQGVKSIIMGITALMFPFRCGDNTWNRNLSSPSNFLRLYWWWIDGVPPTGKLISLEMHVTRKLLAMIVLPGYRVGNIEPSPSAIVCSKISVKLFPILAEGIFLFWVLSASSWFKNRYATIRASAAVSMFGLGLIYSALGINLLSSINLELSW